MLTLNIKGLEGPIKWNYLRKTIKKEGICMVWFGCRKLGMAMWVD